MFAVYRRIGDLEMLQFVYAIQFFVYRRIGDLENHDTDARDRMIVYRRIGDLETKMRRIILQVLSLSPHR